MRFAMMMFLVTCITHVSGAEVIIRSLKEDDWESFRDLRLKALKEAPKAYGIAVEDEIVRSDEEWKKLCLEAFQGNGKWYVVAQHEGKLIGMLGAFELSGTYMRHQVEIGSAFVEESFRRQGILEQMYYALKAQLKEVPHLEQMIVWVTLHEKQTSKRAFEKFGFTYAGTLSKTVKFEEQYYDCCWLEAPL